MSRFPCEHAFHFSGHVPRSAGSGSRGGCMFRVKEVAGCFSERPCGGAFIFVCSLKPAAGEGKTSRYSRWRPAPRGVAGAPRSPRGLEASSSPSDLNSVLSCAPSLGPGACPSVGACLRLLRRGPRPRLCSYSAKLCVCVRVCARVCGHTVGRVLGAVPEPGGSRGSLAL